MTHTPSAAGQLKPAACPLLAAVLPVRYAIGPLDPRHPSSLEAEALGLPALALGHTLLAIALVLTFGNVTGRRGASGSLVIVAIPAMHIVFLVLLQSMLRAEPRLAALLAALVLAEILFSAYLIRRLNYGPRIGRLARKDIELARS